MAESIAEWLLMRHFFHDVKDRRKHAIMKKLFFTDMQFNLSTGTVSRATEKLRNRHTVVSYLNFEWVLIGRDHLEL